MMNKYRIYLNNNDLTDCLDILADYPQIMESLSLFYNGGDLVASIPSYLVFIKLEE